MDALELFTFRRTRDFDVEVNLKYMLEHNGFLQSFEFLVH